MSTGDAVHLRPATRSDRSFVERLSSEVFARFGRYDRILPPLVKHPLVCTLIAETPEGAAGFAMFSWLSLSRKAEADLVAIAVSALSQRRGIGRVLLEGVEREVRREAGGVACSVRLTVAEDNLPARRLFESAGYRPIPGVRGCYEGGQLSLGMRKALPPFP